MTKKINKIEYLSMSEAAKMTPYAQDYLSLLCRRGQLKGKKIRRKWYTTVEWINDYLKEMRPNEVIESKIKSQESRINSNTKEKHRKKRIFENGLILQPLVFWALSMAAILVLIVGIYSVINKKIENIQAESEKFTPSEVVKIPNEKGGFDLYGEGRMKIGEEEGSNQKGLILEP
jgi:hypothetical protein